MISVVLSWHSLSLFESMGVHYMGRESYTQGHFTASALYTVCAYMCQYTVQPVQLQFQCATDLYFAGSHLIFW